MYSGRVAEVLREAIVERRRSARGRSSTVSGAPKRSPPALDKNVYEYLTTSGDRNFGGYSNPSLDQILANARKATSARSLRTLWHAAFQTIISDRPIIFVGHRIDYAAVSSDVRGVEFLSDLQPRVSFAQKS